MSDFYAKPSGGYAIGSTQGNTNCYRTYDYLTASGYARNCIIGILGNVYGESALNPWLWENNTYNLNNGYGLFQAKDGTKLNVAIDDLEEVDDTDSTLNVLDVTTTPSFDKDFNDLNKRLRCC